MRFTRTSTRQVFRGILELVALPFRRLLGVLRERTFWALLFFSVLVVVVAYQVPFHFQLALGSPLGTPIDQPFLSRFYPAEQGQDGTFRWTARRSSIILDGIGSGTPLRLTFRALTLRPPGATGHDTTVSLDELELAEFEEAADWKDYVVEIPAERNPDRLRLIFESTPLQQVGDPRERGIVISKIQIDAIDEWAVTIPSPWQTLLFILIAIGLYATLRQLGMKERRIFWVGAVCLVAIAAMIAWARPFYTVFSQNIIGWIGLNYVLALTLPWIVRGLYLRAGIRMNKAELLWLCLVFLIGFNMRWIARLYPTTMFGDTLFHLHRLDAVAAGQIIFSSTSGAIGFEQTIPYPPGLYLILTPLTTLFSDHLALMNFFVAFVDSLGAVLVYLLVRAATERSRAALFASALYLFLPIAVLNIAWAVYANLLAQFALLLGITIWFFQQRRAAPGSWVWLAFALGVAFLTHVTAPLLWLAFGAVAAALLWFGFKTARRALVIRPLLISAAAFLVAVGLYYGEFVPLITQGTGAIFATRVERGNQDTALAIVGGGVKYSSIGLVRVPVYSVTEWVVEGAKGLGREAWVYFAVWALALAPVGFYWLGRQEQGRLLAILGWAGLLVGGLFALVGIIFDMHVRYPLFLLPFAAMGSGVALDALSQRGRVFFYGTCALFAFTAIVSLLLWQRFL